MYSPHYPHPSQAVARQQIQIRSIRSCALVQPHFTIVLHNTVPIRRYEIVAAQFLQQLPALEQRKQKNSPAVQVISTMRPNPFTAASKCLVFTEHIVRTFEQTQKFTLCEALYTLRELMKLFRSLSQKWPICFSEKACGFNHRGQLIGWINPDLCLNSPSEAVIKSPETIVRKILQAIYAKCINKDHPFFHDILSVKCDFENILSFVESSYAVYGIYNISRIILTSLLIEPCSVSFKNSLDTPLSVKASFVADCQMVPQSKFVVMSPTEGRYERRVKFSFSQGKDKEAVNSERAKFGSNGRIPSLEDAVRESSLFPVREFSTSQISNSNAMSDADYQSMRRSEIVTGMKSRKEQRMRKNQISSNQFEFHYEPPKVNPQLSIIVESEPTISVTQEKTSSISFNKESKMTCAHTSSCINENSLQATSFLSMGSFSNSRIGNSRINKETGKEGIQARFTFGQNNTYGIPLNHPSLREEESETSNSNIFNQSGFSARMVASKIQQDDAKEGNVPMRFRNLGSNPKWKNFLNELRVNNQENLKQSYHVGPEIRIEPVRLELLKYFGREIKESCIQQADH